MKNIKTALIFLIVLALLSGLFVKGLNKNNAVTRQEFLFDTLCTITSYSKSDADAIEKAFDAAAQIHRLADYYSDSSDTSKINDAKANEAILVNSDTMNMLKLSHEIYKKSNGAFDITVAPISHLWKFNEESPIPPTKEQVKKLLPLVDGDALILNTTTLTVTKKYEHIKIDLGGIAKGYAADIAAEVLKAKNVKSALVDFGGNIVAIGENPKTHNNKWRIGLQTPYAPTGEYSKIIEINDGAVVTSGTYQRYFELNGKKYHHIIDPKTGYPSYQNFESVTVAAESAAICDCLATAIFVMGKEQGMALAKGYNAEVYFLP